MAWTSKVNLKIWDGNRFRVDVTYDDGAGNTFVEPIFLTTGDSNSFSVMVRNRINQLIALDALNASLTVDAPVPVPPADPIPTTLQLDSAQFQKDWIRWQQVEKAISNQILTGSEPQVTNFLARIKNEFNQVIADAQAAGQTVAQSWATALNLL